MDLTLVGAPPRSAANSLSRLPRRSPCSLRWRLGTAAAVAKPSLPPRKGVTQRVSSAGNLLIRRRNSTHTGACVLPLGRRTIWPVRSPHATFLPSLQRSASSSRRRPPRRAGVSAAAARGRRPEQRSADRAQPHRAADDPVDSRHRATSASRIASRAICGIGDFSELANDLFRLDNGAVIGLEYRFGITSEHPGRDPSLHAEQDTASVRAMGCRSAREARCRSAVGPRLDRRAGQPARWPSTRGRRVPSFANVGPGPCALCLAHVRLMARSRPSASAERPTNTNTSMSPPPTASLAGDEDHSRHDEHVLRRSRRHGSACGRACSSSVSISPRLAGHDPGEAMWGVAIEKWTRGHTLAVDIDELSATTPGQIARGGTPDALYLGFNITRQF